MDKKKGRYFDCSVDDDGLEAIILVESEGFYRQIRIPDTYGTIEELINELEVLEENVSCLISDLVEHAQELEDEETR